MNPIVGSFAVQCPAEMIPSQRGSRGLLRAKTLWDEEVTRR